MPARNYYRGGYGDVAPVTVHPSKALDHEGKIRPDHFATEAAAWGSILAYCEDGVKHAKGREDEAEKTMQKAVADLIRRQVHQRKVDQAYRVWKTRHPASVAV